MDVNIKLQNDVIETILNALDDEGLFGSPVYLITSSDNILHYQNELMGRVKQKGTFRTSIFTFERLMWHIYNEIGAGDKVQVSLDAHALIIYRLIREHALDERLHYFTNGKDIEESSIQHIAFAYEILQAIEEIENYVVDENIHDFLNRLIDESKVKGFSETSKLIAIQYIYDKYHAHIKHKSVDQQPVQISSVNLLRDFVFRLAQEGDKLKNTKALKGATLFVSGITAIKPIELKLLQIFNDLGVSIEILDTEIAIDQLLSSIDYPVWFDGRFNLNDVIEKQRLKDKLNCFEAPNNRIEFDVIAHRILHDTNTDTNDAALSFKDIVVYYRSQNDLLQMIRTFDQYGIPVQFDEQKPLTVHPFAQLIMGLFEFVNIKHDNKHHQAYIETFIKIIKTKYLTNAVLNTYLDRIDDFVHSYAITYGEMLDNVGHFSPELLLRKKFGDKLNQDEISSIIAMFNDRTYTSIVEERQAYYDALGKDTSEGNVDFEDMNRDEDVDNVGKNTIAEEKEDEMSVNLEKVNTSSFVDMLVVLEHLYDKVNVFKTIFDQDTSDISAVLNNINEYLSVNNIYSKLSGQYSFYEEEQKVEIQQIYNQFVNMMESGFVAFNEFTVQPKDVLTILTDMFDTMFNNASFSSERYIKDAVQLKLLDKVSMQKFKRAYIASFDRNNTPKLVKDNQVLSDAIKEIADGRLSLTTIEQANRDVLLMYLAMQSADKVSLSYSIINHEGRETKESPLLTALMNKLDIKKYSDQYRQYTDGFNGAWIEKDTSVKDAVSVQHLDTDYNILPPVRHLLIPLIQHINQRANLSADKVQTDIKQYWDKALKYIQKYDSEQFEKLKSYYHFYSQQENNTIEHDIAHHLFLSKDRRDGEDGTYVFEPSVSRFQLYNGCAFKHFAQYGLHLQTRESFDIQPNEIGSLQHAVLEELFRDEIMINRLRNMTSEFLTVEFDLSKAKAKLKDNKLEATKLKYEKTEEKLNQNYEKEANCVRKNTKKYQEIINRISKLENELRDIEKMISDYEMLEEKFKVIQEEIDTYDKEVFNIIFEKVSQHKSVNTKFNHTHYNEFMLRKISRAIFNALKLSSMQSAGSRFNPHYFEKDFGYRSDSDSHASVDRIETVELSEQLKTYDIYIKGQIDRIDIYKHEVDGKKIAFINVIDYKLSKKKLELKDVLEGGQLQQFSYMYVIMNNIEQFGIRDCVAVLPSTMMFHPVYNEILEIKNDSDLNNFSQKVYKKLKPDGMFINDIAQFNKEYEMNESIALTNLVSGNTDSFDLNFRAKLLNDYYPVRFSGKEVFKEYIEETYRGNLPEERRNSMRLIRDEDQKKFLSQKGFDNVMQHVKDIYKQNTKEIFSGSVAAHPREDKVGKVNPCHYCEFSSACYFDMNNAKTRKLDVEEINLMINEIMGGC
ncbi:PD-(D/E)XK nuclease family protein [Macrococcoides canis]|uniref:PD-(D/E)XK nuclease family protein n=1 Tax=Macrococcoides canis TaxID=1855823 RepID=UPI0020B6E3E8|nr:PD-(D/E)XK nuclease family protein [Macrococcus canis]UTH02881.1 PD-(D/E)XK nuclease family protein [Macrococcus canis]